MREFLQRIAFGLAAIVVAWLALHAFISPVNPEQEPPKKHVTTACWSCHIVSGSAKIREPDQPKPR